MAALTMRQQLEEAEREVEDHKRGYLRRFGWDHTCNTPGSYWLYRRDFAAEDAARHAQWKERGAGPLGMPSEPQPYGVITAGVDLAVSITKSALDYEIDQDGDPETKVITLTDLQREHGDSE